MFPSVKTRFTARLTARLGIRARRGLDLAVEFATLGEYRLPEAQEGAAGEPAPRTRRSRAVTPAAPVALPVAARRVKRLAPATALARRLQPPAAAPAGRLQTPATAPARRLQPPAAPGRRIKSHSAVRALALSPREAPARPRARVRAGAAAPQPQPCLVGDVTGTGTMTG